MPLLSAPIVNHHLSSLYAVHAIAQKEVIFYGEVNTKIKASVDVW